MNIIRLLKVPKHHFFLFGPRGTGKSTWLADEFKANLTIDLLKSEDYFALSAQPSILRSKVQALPAGSRIVIDEVQKLPILLDEVHSLIFEFADRYQFALTGSSARKLKRSNANLLAGRAIKKEMFPFTSVEHGNTFSIQESLQWGSLPAVTLADDTQVKKDFLYTYVDTYLKEEISSEAAVRNLQNYYRFLRHAAVMNARVINMSNLSREAAIPRSTVDGYFEILVETLLGTFVEPIHLKAKIKEVVAPKFYFFDCGVVRAIRNELDEPLGEETGYFLETFVLNELKAYSSYSSSNFEIYFWGTPSHAEVDFIVCKGKKKWAIEIKSSKTWKREFNKGLHSAAESRKLDKLIGVYLGKDPQIVEDVEVLPIEIFCKKLFDGSLLS